MKQEDVKNICNEISILRNKKLEKIGRASAMVWFSFLSGEGKEYALHLQCSFRIRTDDKISIANLDMFEPTQSLEESPSFDWDTYDWDVQGFNRYDEWTTQYNKNKENHVIVEDVEVNVFGDLTIKCNHGIIVEVFINAIDDKECWRFFERHSKDNHLVVTGQGIDEY